MRYNREVFRYQFPIVKEFVYHVVCYRELSNSNRALGLRSVFWTSTIDAHLMMASIQWCIVFGTHSNTNPMHWKRLSEDESKELEGSFRQGLTQQLGITHQQFEKYWEKMKDFRDNYVAHKMLGGYKKPVPNFTDALNIAFYC